MKLSGLTRRSLVAPNQPRHNLLRLLIDLPVAARARGLIDAETDAGAYTITWNGRDDLDTASASGVYFARLTSPAGTRTYKMTLLK